MAETQQNNKRTKHIHISYHYIREKIQQKANRWGASRRVQRYLACKEWLSKGPCMGQGVGPGLELVELCGSSLLVQVGMK